MLSVTELLERKFTFIEVDYAIEQGVIAFNRPNPNPKIELTSNERVDKSTPTPPSALFSFYQTPA
jgi:hypothetical protein